MKLNFERTVHLSKLHDELLAAMPELRPVDDEQPVITVEGDDTEVWLTVPDWVDVAAVEEVVADHDPTPPEEPDPDEELDALLGSATTIEALRDAFIGRVKAR